jgi:hypothetical protein
MNSRYFGCKDCETYTDAGYRWAFWLLEEPGIVQLGQSVTAEAILSVAKYWDPPAEDRSEWLCRRILPRVRRFLTAHQNHRLTYIEADSIFDPDGPCADWAEWPTK